MQMSASRTQRRESQDLQVGLLSSCCLEKGHVPVAVNNRLLCFKKLRNNHHETELRLAAAAHLGSAQPAAACSESSCCYDSKGSRAGAGAAWGDSLEQGTPTAGTAAARTSAQPARLEAV